MSRASLLRRANPTEGRELARVHHTVRSDCAAISSGLTVDDARAAFSVAGHRRSRRPAARLRRRLCDKRHTQGKSCRVVA